MAIDVANLQIVKYPDPVLRARAAAPDASPEVVRAVAARMIELMREADGIGLAAPQVGLSWRLFVVDIPPSDDPEDAEWRSLLTDPVSATDGPRVYINPVLSEPSRDLVAYEEGCLSLPHINGDVRRPSEITISATDENGRAISQRGGGLLARCWQHEMDHLDGVLIIDRMTPLGRLKNRGAVKELEQRAATL